MVFDSSIRLCRRLTVFEYVMEDTGHASVVYLIIGEEALFVHRLTQPLIGRTDTFRV